MFAPGIFELSLILLAVYYIISIRILRKRSKAWSYATPLKWLLIAIVAIIAIPAIVAWLAICLLALPLLLLGMLVQGKGGGGAGGAAATEVVKTSIDVLGEQGRIIAPHTPPDRMPGKGGPEL